MPGTLHLTEPAVPVYMTIGADDPYRITADPTRELEFSLVMVDRWRFSVRLSGQMRTRPMLQLLDACAEHGAARRVEPSLGMVYRYAVQLAFYCISALPPGAQDPECGVDRDGEINLEWFGARGHVLTLSIAATGRITYAYLHGEHHERGALAMSDRIPPRLLELIRLFT